MSALVTFEIFSLGDLKDVDPESVRRGGFELAVNPVSRNRNRLVRERCAYRLDPEQHGVHR